MPIKPRGEVTRSNSPKDSMIPVAEPQIEIAAWSPGKAGEGVPPEQVHFIITLPGISPVPMVLRFKSPDSIGFFIEELAKYRREVWPDCEPVKIDDKPGDQPLHDIGFGSQGPV